MITFETREGKLYESFFERLTSNKCLSKLAVRFEIQNDFEKFGRFV